MKIPVLILFILITVMVNAQSYTVSGTVVDSEKGVKMSSIALLYPTDSTVAFFTMSDEKGVFRFRHVNQGRYILNINKENYESLMTPIELTSADTNLGVIVLYPLSKEIETVEVIAERTPLIFKGDTIEYNASSFRTQPNAVTEDLLRKLPGIEVDAAGNIKAQGQTIEKIMVDGKEFFSNDPKVVSQNLPAEAIKKVQVFDEKSDFEQMTETTDADKNPTINLILKENSKNLWFGNTQIGGGTNQRFEGGIKAFNFTSKHQLAILGMSNNINRFGFSVDDYIDYTGGVQQFIDNGGKLELNSSEVPIDFGQPIYGNNTSGVGAINYSINKHKNKNTNFTYLGSAIDKRLSESYKKSFFLPAETIYSNGNTLDNQFSGNQRIGFNHRNKTDSTRQLRINCGMTFTNGRNELSSDAQDTLNNFILNSYQRESSNRHNEIKGDGSVSFTKKTGKNRFSDILRINGDFSSRFLNSGTNWMNKNQFYTTNTLEIEQQRLNTQQVDGNGSLSIAFAKLTTKKWLLEAQLKTSIRTSLETRLQELWLSEYKTIDSISGKFQTSNYNLRPGLSIQRTVKKTTLNASINYDLSQQVFLLRNSISYAEKKYGYFTPQFSIDYAINQTNNLRFELQSGVNLPTISQLNPITSVANRMQFSTGNPNLIAEYYHSANISWRLFDHFNFISTFINANFTYTLDKINISRTVFPDYSQSISFVNVKDDKSGVCMIDFSAPIRKLKLTTHLRLSGQLNQGISIVNGVDNQTINMSHKYEFSVENRKKEKWDLLGGIRVNFSNTRFSFQQSLNNNFTDLTGFGTIRYLITDKWSFETKIDISNYQITGQENSIIIPLISSTISRFLFKSRATISFTGYDLLNRNTGIQQSSRLNYFEVTRSNVLNRYYMLKFTYKLKSKQ